MNFRSLFLCAACMLAPTAFAQDAIYVNKASVEFLLQAHQDKPEWRWTPRATFRLNGKVQGGTVIEIQYTALGGKPWLKIDCSALEYSAFSDNKSQVISDCGKEFENAQATNLTGVFGFKMTLKNALSGNSQELFSGKFKVDRVLYNPSGTAAGSKQFYYTANRDSRLQLAHVYMTNDNGIPFLTSEIYFKGPKTENSGNAYLFYNGQQVAKASSGSTQLGYTDAGPTKYFRHRFRFDAMAKAQYQEGYGAFRLYENPGDYEIKIMLTNKVVRSIKLKIGANGHPVDDADVVGGNKIGAPGVLVAAMVMGDLDSPWDNSSIKTDGLWGNPLTGLLVP